MTIEQMLSEVPGVSKATMYRQVALLAEGGLIAVASERRVHGAVERQFRRSKGRIDNPQIDDCQHPSIAIPEAVVRAIDVMVEGLNATQPVVPPIERLGSGGANRRPVRNAPHRRDIGASPRGAGPEAVGVLAPRGSEPQWGSSIRSLANAARRDEAMHHD